MKQTYRFDVLRGRRFMRGRSDGAGRIGRRGKGGPVFRFDYTEMAGGVALIPVGASVGFISDTQFPPGTLQHMAPEMFPAGLGIILAGLGPTWYEVTVPKAVISSKRICASLKKA